MVVMCRFILLFLFYFLFYFEGVFSLSSSHLLVLLIILLSLFWLEAQLCVGKVLFLAADSFGLVGFSFVC